MKIAVVGKMRSGKDTLAEYFLENDYAVKLAFGDEIKRVANFYFPEIVRQGKPRKLYQMIGQTFREFNPNIWIKFLDTKLGRLKDFGLDHRVVVSDVRQMNEYEYLKSQGFTVIKVWANDEIRRERIIKSGDVVNEEDFNHETETITDTIPCDYCVVNNGTLEEFMENIKIIHADIERVDAT